MDIASINEGVVDYITKRSCSGGGYCFYRLEEPNPHDTYFALATLDLLQVPCDAEPTIRYLQALQQPDGGYASMVQAFFVLSGLHFLGGRPLYDPRAGIETFTAQLIDLALRPADASASFCHALHRLATLRAMVGLEWQEAQRMAIVQAVQAFRWQDGGFGIEGATLPDTYYVTCLLKHLGSPLTVDSLAPFIRACEHPVFGFTGKPGTALFFLEYLCAGLALCDEISLLPTYRQACFSFLCQCQTNSGGFARTNLAIATLEGTYFAIRGFQILARMMDLG